MRTRRYSGPYRRYQRRRARRRFVACLPGLALIAFSLGAFAFWAWFEITSGRPLWYGSVPF